MANEDGITKLALTPIGTGGAGIPIDTFIDALAEDVVDYIYMKAKSLRVVIIACNDTAKAKLLLDKFKKKIATIYSDSDESSDDEEYNADPYRVAFKKLNPDPTK